LSLNDNLEAIESIRVVGCGNKGKIVGRREFKEPNIKKGKGPCLGWDSDHYNTPGGGEKEASSG